MTVRSLAAVALVLAAGAGNADEQDKKHQYAGATKCRSCHEKEAIGNQYGQWLESKHAKAYETLGGAKAKEWAEKKGIADPQASDDCLECHVTGHGAPKELLGMKWSAAEGVTCEGCHGAGSDYRKKKVMTDQKEAVKRGLVLQNEKVCTTCHNDKSPAWDPKRFTTKDGKKVGFDYEQAVKKISHPVPKGYDPSKDSESE